MRQRPPRGAPDWSRTALGGSLFAVLMLVWLRHPTFAFLLTLGAAIAATCAAAMWALAAARAAVLRRTGVDELAGLDAVRLAQRTGQVFRDLGYRLRVNGRGNGRRAAVLAERQGTRVMILAWHCGRGEVVDAQGIRETLATTAFYQAQRAIIVTGGTFGPTAIELARVTGVELWDRQRLIDVLALQERARLWRAGRAGADETGAAS